MDLRMGVIGVGGLGYLQTKTYAAIEGVTIVAGADVSKGARTLFKQEFGAPAYRDYQEFLHEHAAAMDAVTIVTPHTFHYEQAKACLKEGLHVLVEKPMTTDVAHAVELVEKADDAGLVLQVGYQRHFHPGFKELRRLLNEGRVGALHTANCNLGQDWIGPHNDTWRANPSLSGGGQLYDTGSHLLDALLWTTTTDPSNVAAQIQYAKPSVDVNSALALQLTTSDGRPIIASVGITGDGMDLAPSEAYFFWGDEGRIVFSEGHISVTEKGAMTYRTEIVDGIDFQTLNREKIENFVASIEGHTPPAVPGEVGLKVTALTEAAYRAANTGTSVSVDEIIRDAKATVES